MKKRFVTIILAGALTVSSAFTALAGWEQTETTWKYQNNDGSYIMNQWVWLDGNNDGIFESYCFDGNGDLYISTTTPDGYIVNENGAWTVNGIVQTKVMGNNTSTSHDNKTSTPTPESQAPTQENNNNNNSGGSGTISGEKIAELIPGWNGGDVDVDEITGGVDIGAGGTWH